MKGIAHFITGVAIATFFPQIVEQAAGGSLLPVMGGIAGILPDTLDFKFARYFERYDVEIDPGPEPDARGIAEQVVEAMQRAYETRRPQRVMLHTVRLGADLWRQYAIQFDPQRNEVAVRVGPVVNTNQMPLPGWAGCHGTHRNVEGLQGLGPDEVDAPWVSCHGTPHDVGGLQDAEVRLKIGVPMAPTYDAETKIDIFSGPSFKFERRGEQIHIHFLDWHRRWSHSLTLAAALGLLGGLVLGKWAGLAIGLGLTGHVLEDQLGFMGSNLFPPFTRERTRGLQLCRSGDAVPNFLTVWTAVALILFNLDRFSAQPRLDPGWFLGLAVALPVVVMGGLYQWRRRHGEPEAKEALQQRDILSETEEVGQE